MYRTRRQLEKIRDVSKHMFSFGTASFLCLSLALLTACGGEGSGLTSPESPASVGSPSTVIDYAAKSTCTHTDAPKPLTFFAYNVTNNMWGVFEKLAANTLPYAITVCVEGKQKSPTEMSAKFTWSLPQWDGKLVQADIKAYPSIVHGHELNGATSSPSIFPRAISDSTKVVANYDVTVTSNGLDQTFFDVVYTSSPNSNNLTTDIVIDVGVSPYAPRVSDYIEDIVVDDILYKVYRNSDLTPPRYSIWFALQKPNMKGTLRLKPFNDYLVRKGFVAATDYIETIDFGTEVITGTGETIVRSYSITQ